MTRRCDLDMMSSKRILERVTLSISIIDFATGNDNKQVINDKRLL